MKKTSILIAMFAAIASIQNINAGESVDFDGKLKSQAMHENIPLDKWVEKTTCPDGPSSVAYEVKLPAMGEVLRGIPPKDRNQFLNSLVLKNGRIIYGNATLLGTFGENMAREILMNSDIDANTDFNASPRLIQMSALLSEVPADIRSEFLERLVFMNGRFASAYVGGLRRAMGDAAVNKILAAIVTDPQKTPKAEGARALCGNGICNYAYCAYVWQKPHCRSTDSEDVCDSSCGS